VEVARGAVEAEAVPVEDTVGGVGILLDLVDEKAGSDGVEATGRNENGLVFFWLDGVNLVGDAAVLQRGCEVLFGHAVFEADVEFGPRVAVGDIPHFCLSVAAEFFGHFDRRMDLNREVITGIEDFDEEGEPLAGESGPEDLLAVVDPEIVEGFSCQGPVVDDGLLIFPVAHFPGLAVGLLIGELALIDAFHGAPPPDPGHVERRKCDRFH